MLRNILAVIIGIILGGIVNMGLIMISGSIIPPPVGTDLTTPEGLNAAADLLEPKHFLFPFLAHALGTLVGTFLTVLIAKSRQFNLAMLIGAFFLIGGVSAAFMIPAPTWFIVLDLVLAYLPMAWLGYLLQQKLSAKNNL